MTSESSEEEIQRFKQMYMNGTVSLEVYEAMIEYYIAEEGGNGPSVLGISIPSSVDPDAPPADPAKHPGVTEGINE